MALEPKNFDEYPDEEDFTPIEDSVFDTDYDGDYDDEYYSEASDYANDFWGQDYYDPDGRLDRYDRLHDDWDAYNVNFLYSNLLDSADNDNRPGDVIGDVVNACAQQYQDASGEDRESAIKFLSKALYVDVHDFDESVWVPAMQLLAEARGDLNQFSMDDVPVVMDYSDVGLDFSTFDQSIDKVIDAHANNASPEIVNLAKGLAKSYPRGSYFHDAFNEYVDATVSDRASKVGNFLSFVRPKVPDFMDEIKSVRMGALYHNLGGCESAYKSLALSIAGSEPYKTYPETPDSPDSKPRSICFSETMNDPNAVCFDYHVANLSLNNDMSGLDSKIANPHDWGVDGGKNMSEMNDYALLGQRRTRLPATATNFRYHQLLLKCSDACLDGLESGLFADRAKELGDKHFEADMTTILDQTHQVQGIAELLRSYPRARPYGRVKIDEFIDNMGPDGQTMYSLVKLTQNVAQNLKDKGIFQVDMDAYNRGALDGLGAIRSQLALDTKFRKYGFKDLSRDQDDTSLNTGHRYLSEGTYVLTGEDTKPDDYSPPF